MKILQFFQGQDGENSAKRLIGIIAGLVFCVLTMIGGLHFLAKDQSKEFQDLIGTVGYFSGTLLGFGIADIFLKKKYDIKPPANHSN
jgi:hypothetical protein